MKMGTILVPSFEINYTKFTIDGTLLVPSIYLHAGRRI